MLLLLLDAGGAPIPPAPPGVPAAGLGEFLAEVTDHTAQGVARLLEQFKHKPRIESMLSIYLDQVQDLEAALFDLITERSLATAVGAQLDGLGRVIGRDRNGMSDTDYRTVLNAQIRVNISDGQPEQLIEIVSLMVGTSLTIALTDYYPAELEVVIDGPVSGETAALVGELLQDAKAAGVRLVLIYSSVAPSDTFTLSRAVDFPSFDAAKGFDSAATPGTGTGKLTGAIE